MLRLAERVVIYIKMIRITDMAPTNVTVSSSGLALVDAGEIPGVLKRGSSRAATRPLARDFEIGFADNLQKGDPREGGPIFQKVPSRCLTLLLLAGRTPVTRID